ncbi:MAG: hypothetical protein Q8Q26_11585 [Pseudorhodobacter sp.]|nr:hypothetical protein [Pseudorhodobacter sp.]
MTLKTRLNRLEGHRAPDAGALELDLPPDLCARIAAAKAAGTFPRGLSDADIDDILAADDKARGRI